MLARITVLLPFLALLAKAITVTSPTEGQNWGTTGAQTVAWNSVESDPSSFTVLLVNDVSLPSTQHHPFPSSYFISKGPRPPSVSRDKANLDYIPHVLVRL